MFFMKYLLFMILFILPFGSLSAQGESASFVHPVLPTYFEKAEELVPKGWKLIAIETDDLNGDKIPDVAVIMRMNHPDNIITNTGSSYYKLDNQNPYLLVIGFRKDSRYQIISSHHALFPRKTAPLHATAPLDDQTIMVKHGVLSLSFQYLRSNEQFKFRWNGKSFELIGYDCAYGRQLEFNILSVNYLTWKAIRKYGRNDSEKINIRNLNIKRAKRPNLREIDPDIVLNGIDSEGNSLTC